MSSTARTKSAAVVAAARQTSAGMRRLEALAEAPDTGSFFAGFAGDSPGYLDYLPGLVIAVGQRVMLPLELVRDNPANPRVFYPEDEFRDLKDSLAQNGQQTAVQVYPCDSAGVYMLKSGHRRVRALRALGKATVKAEIVAKSGDFFKDYREARDINRQHKSHTHFDDAVRFQEFLDAGHVPHQKALSEHLGVPEAVVSKCLSISKLPREALSFMAEHSAVFGLAGAYSAYRYWVTTQEDGGALSLVLQKMVSGAMSARQLELLAAEAKAAPAAKRREQALSRAQIRGAGTGELKAFEGKLLLKLEGLPVETRDDLFGRILAAFRDAGLEVDAAGPRV